jgi:hypothetical protein
LPVENPLEQLSLKMDAAGSSVLEPTAKIDAIKAAVSLCQTTRFRAQKIRIWVVTALKAPDLVECARPPCSCGKCLYTAS